MLTVKNVFAVSMLTYTVGTVTFCVFCQIFEKIRITHCYSFLKFFLQQSGVTSVFWADHVYPDTDFMLIPHLKLHYKLLFPHLKGNILYGIIPPAAYTLALGVLYKLDNRIVELYTNPSI